MEMVTRERAVFRGRGEPKAEFRALSATVQEYSGELCD